MSTQINHYVMYGVLLPYPEYPKFTDEMRALLEPYCDDAFDADVNPKDGLTVLMGDGDYIAIGHVIAKSDVGALGFEEPVQIKEPPYSEYESGARSALILALGMAPEKFAPGWIVISHDR